MTSRPRWRKRPILHAELLSRRIAEIAQFVDRLVNTEPIMLGKARPPAKPGVYVFYDPSGRLAYVGKSTCHAGLLDRIGKHIAGSDTHAIQRAYAEEFPDRVARREFIKSHVRAAWIELDDARETAYLEQYLIWLLRPQWNRL